jgi:hypothetical protein
VEEQSPLVVPPVEASMLGQKEEKSLPLADVKCLEQRMEKEFELEPAVKRVMVEE